MRLLVLGGTRFVGRVLVEQALRRGDEVTTFNRGRTGADASGVEAVRGDREDSRGLRALMEGREWDAVVDTSGYVPTVVGEGARAVAGRARAYAFFSTVSVYPGWPDEGVAEDSSVHECAPDAGGSAEDEASWSAAQYGAYKAGCEWAARAGFDGQVVVLRPGVILGPEENVGRLPWWLRRVHQGGRMLAPGSPGREIQPIDVRDVAAFTLHCLDSEAEGTMNVAAPRAHATFGGLLDACAAATGVDPQRVWMDDQFLLDQGVRQWTELPLWRTHPGTWRMSTDRARTVGLACRPLGETVRDTWTWLQHGQGPSSYARQSHHGLAPEKEQRLLQLWE